MYCHDNTMPLCIMLVLMSLGSHFLLGTYGIVCSLSFSFVIILMMMMMTLSIADMTMPPSNPQSLHVRTMHSKSWVENGCQNHVNVRQLSHTHHSSSSLSTMLKSAAILACSSPSFFSIVVVDLYCNHLDYGLPIASVRCCDGGTRSMYSYPCSM